MKNLKIQNVHLWPLINLHTKFQLPSSIWRENRGGMAIFWSKQKETPHISLPFPSILTYESDFWKRYVTLDCTYIGLKRNNFDDFSLSAPLSQIRAKLNFDRRSVLLQNIKPEANDTKMSFGAIWMLKVILWLIPILWHPKNKFILGSYFSSPPSPRNHHIFWETSGISQHVAGTEKLFE